MKYIDKNKLIKVFENDLEILDEIITKFLEIYPNEITSLEQKIKEKDYPKIQFLGHSIKSAVSNFRPNNILECLFEIEMAGRNQDIDKIVELFPTVKEMLIEMADELKSLKISK